nr:MAG TPA: hypothetical protein [Caudoviricetes sp.]
MAPRARRIEPKQIKKSTPQGVASLRGFCIHF